MSESTEELEKVKNISLIIDEYLEQGISLAGVPEKLRALCAGGSLPEESEAEEIAMGMYLSENPNTKPALDYAIKFPGMAWPAISSLTERGFLHLMTRAESAGSLELRARYADTCWIYGKSHLPNKRRFECALLAAKSYLAAAGQFTSCENNTSAGGIVNVIKCINRAIAIGKEVSQTEVLEEAVSLILRMDAQPYTSLTPIWWTWAARTIYEDKKLLQIYQGRQAESVKENLIKRLDNLISSKKELPVDLLPVFAMLAELYFKESDRKKVKQIVKMGLDYCRETVPGAALVAKHWVSQYAEMAYKYGISIQEMGAGILISDLGQEVNKQLKAHEIEFSVSKEVWEAELRPFLNFNEEGKLAYLGARFTSRADHIKAHMESQMKSHPVSYLFSIQIPSSKGLTVATIPPAWEDPDFQDRIVHEACLWATLEWLMLNHCIDNLQKERVFTEDKVLCFLSKSACYRKGLSAGIEEGVKAYFAGEYVGALHMLVPEIENCVRELIKCKGGVTIELCDNGAMQEMSLGKLLNIRKEFLEGIYEHQARNIILHIKALWADPRGWNLRNLICHGLMEREEYGQMQADYAIQTLLFLALPYIEAKAAI